MRITLCDRQDSNNLTKFLRNISIYLEKKKRGRKDYVKNMDHGINQDGQINKHKGEKEYANRVQNLKNKITNEVSLLELRVVRLFSPIKSV